MDKLSKGDVAFNGLMATLVQRIIDGWNPAEKATETAYRDSLLKFMRELVPEGCRVEREYRHEGTTADLYLSWKGLMFSDEVFIEMKRNLQKKAAYDRLIGQIEELKPTKHKIIVILAGKTDEGLLGRLNEHYRNYVNGRSSAVRTMAIILKDPSAKDESGSPPKKPQPRRFLRRS